MQQAPALPSLTIVITTFNRRALVCNAIDSALAWFNQGYARQIIVVDDASTDGTSELLIEHYASLISNHELVLLNLSKNSGVTAAKNTGAAAAAFSWVAFLDSDDQLIPDAAKGVAATLQDHSNNSIIFFRCIDTDTGKLVGVPTASAKFLETKTILRSWAFGDCMPIIQTRCIHASPYLSKLRGFEGLTHARISRRFGPLCLSTVISTSVARTNNDLRLSNPQQLTNRSCQMALGFLTLMYEFPVELGINGLSCTALRSAYYTVKCIMNRLTWHRTP